MARETSRSRREEKHVDPHRARRLAAASHEAAGGLRRLRRGQDLLGRPQGRAGRRGRGLDPPAGGGRRADRHRRRAARVELRDVPDHRHARGHRARGQPRRRRPVLRDLRRRAPPPAPAPDGRAVPLQDVRVRVRREEPRDRHPPGQAGGHRAVDADAAAPARGRDPRLLARPVPERPLRRVREGHPPVLRGRRGARLDRLHRGPPREQERLAQPVDRRGHAAGLHRPQQPRDRPLLGRGAASTSASTPAPAATATPCTRWTCPTRSC